MVLRPFGAPLAAAFVDCRGVPDGLELRSDHGLQYTGADAKDLCRRLLHTFAPVARPTGNAMAERVIQTLKVKLLWTRDWESIAEPEAAIREWVDRYNNERPHQALGWRTPAERRAPLVDQTDGPGNRTASQLHVFDRAKAKRCCAKAWEVIDAVERTLDRRHERV